MKEFEGVFSFFFVVDLRLYSWKFYIIFKRFGSSFNYGWEDILF